MTKEEERQWIEFGKMWTNMSELNQFQFGVSFHPIRYEHEGIDYSKTPYDYLKELYFEKYLLIEDSENDKKIVKSFRILFIHFC